MKQKQVHIGKTGSKSKSWSAYQQEASTVFQKSYKRSALMLACEAEDISAVKKLLGEGNHGINTKNHYHETALMIAAEKGNVELVTLLVEHGANVHETDLHGNTAAMKAFFKGHDSVVGYLQNVGSQIDGSKPAPSFFNPP